MALSATPAYEMDPNILLDKNGYLCFSPNDPENPKNWSKTRRWYITTISCLLALNATMASSAPTATLESIDRILHASSEVGELVTSLFLVGYCAGPLFWAPISDQYGRRWVLYVTYVLYLVFLVLCARAPNIASLLVGRFLTGFFVGGTLTNAPGLLADCWEYVERGEAMALFTNVLFIGPTIAPVISGFFELKEDFRWTFYLLLWTGGPSALLMLTIPETLASAILTRKAKRLRRQKLVPETLQSPREGNRQTLMSSFLKALIQPWRILIDPIALLVTIYLTVVYMLLYMLFTIYPIVFQEKRGWNAGVGELPLTGVIVGACMAGVICIFDGKHAAKKIKRGIQPRPEERLYIAMFSALLFPVAMFWFAWTAEFNSVPWIVPTIAGVFLALVIALTFVAYLNYLTDAYLQQAASANAACTIARSACAAAVPLFTSQMFAALGVGGGGSLIGGVACLMAPVPFLFYYKGEAIRKRSRFAPT